MRTLDTLPHESWRGYQRHVQEQIDRHHKDVAAYIAAYMEQHPHTQLLVSGPPDIVAQFRGWLPPAVQQQIIDTLSLDRHDDRARILAVAQEAIQHHEQEEEQATVQVLLEGHRRRRCSYRAVRY